MGHRIKIATYNIDGLPERLDLNDLPWIFRPFVWIYRFLKGTTAVVINDNQDKERCTEYIGKYLSETDSDIIGVQEDFNFHDILCGHLPEYKCGLHQGGFDLSKIISGTEWCSHFPLPRFKTDGLNIFARKDRINILGEDIVSWNKSYGYFSHANDLFTHKGFRRYTVSVDSAVTIDIYILHMDADFYHAEKCPDVSGDIEARKSQFRQLAEYMLERHASGIHVPMVIMGDTNSSDRYQWDVNSLRDCLVSPINSVDGMSIKQALPENGSDVDRVFYVNDSSSPYKLELLGCSFGSRYAEGVSLSDHKPLLAEFDIVTNKP